MQKVKILFVSLAFFATARHTNGNNYEKENFCENVPHYTSQSFTCCNSKRYELSLPNPFSNAESMKNCLGGDDDKLSKRSWDLYKCMIKAAIKEDITIDSFTTFMSAKFEVDIQEDIKQIIGKVKESEMYKRSSRTKRDADAKVEKTTTTATSVGGSGSGTEGDNTPTPTDNTSTAKPELGNEENDENKTTPPQPIEGEEKTSDDQTTKSPAEESGAVTTMRPTPKRPPMKRIYVQVYNFLSVLDYLDSFKTAIPDEDFLKIWDAYYSAEFEVCQRKAKKEDSEIKSYTANRCASWFQRTARRGECCNAAPVPFPLLNEAILDRDKVENFTAESILKIAGTYTWTNLSYSSNIRRCNRLTTAILLDQVKLEELEAEVKTYADNNCSTTQPDYLSIAKRIIPEYYPSTIKNTIQQTILGLIKEDPKKEENENESKQYFHYEPIEDDADIQRISNLENPVYVWTVPNEWENLDTCKARYVLWSCDAYTMISQRIKYFDITPFCY